MQITITNYELAGIILLSICSTLVAIGVYIILANEIQAYRLRRKHTVRRREGRFLHRL
jgi:hypothetical protein